MSERKAFEDFINSPSPSPAVQNYGRKLLKLKDLELELIEACENILKLAESLASSKFHDLKFAEVARVIAKAKGEL